MCNETPNTVAPATVSGVCPNCGDTVEAGGRGRGRIFCRTRCRELFAARAKSEGAPLLAYVLAWTENRNRKAGSREKQIANVALGQVTAIAREILNRRQADGMPPAADYVETLMATGELYMDRTRR